VCIFLCCLVLFVSTLAKIYFVSKGFPYKDQVEELFIVKVLFYVFPTRDIFNFFVNFTLLPLTYF